MKSPRQVWGKLVMKSETNQKLKMTSQHDVYSGNALIMKYFLHKTYLSSRVRRRFEIKFVNIINLNTEGIYRRISYNESLDGLTIMVRPDYARLMMIPLISSKKKPLR